MSTNILFWIIFNAVIISILIIDLKFVHKNAHVVSIKEAALWSIFWVIVALCFGVGIYFYMDHEKALQFFAGYIIEKSLSIDNLFVFLMIFNYFCVPPIYQPRVLHWGILGALVMRFILIFAGVTLLAKFHWVIYVFGILLIYTGAKMAFQKEKKLEPEKNPVLKIFKKIMPVTSRDFVDEKFFVKINGILHATPLFVVLLLIESSDLIFAVDSIPAILAITTDTFIVYTSNVFAILGLRALYFLLSSLMPLFVYLKFGISIVLCYVGVKMMLVDIYKIPTVFSLMIVVAILGSSVLLSVLMKKIDSLKLKNLLLIGLLTGFFTSFSIHTFIPEDAAPDKCPVCCAGHGFISINYIDTDITVSDHYCLFRPCAIASSIPFLPKSHFLARAPPQI